LKLTSQAAFVPSMQSRADSSLDLKFNSKKQTKHYILIQKASFSGLFDLVKEK